MFVAYLALAVTLRCDPIWARTIQSCFYLVAHDCILHIPSPRQDMKCVDEMLR